MGHDQHIVCNEIRLLSGKLVSLGYDAKAVALMKSLRTHQIGRQSMISCRFVTSSKSPSSQQLRSDTGPSTALWSMDNNDDTAMDRFMEYMGHSKIIDRNIRSATSDADPPNDWPNHRLT